MMKAFIFTLTTRKPLRAPMRPPTASATSSETGTISHSGVSCDAHADAGRAEQDADRHGAERRDRFDRQVHVAGDDDQREADRHDAEHARGLDDVGEDAELEIVRDEDGKDHQHEEQHEPDEVVEDELEGFAGARVHGLIRLALSIARITSISSGQARI